MDKEVALILAELLIKQDETTSQIKEVASEVKDVVKHVNILTTAVNNLTISSNKTISVLNETNSILREFMGVSVKQWERQHAFNDSIVNEIKSIKEVVTNFVQLENRLKAVEERENKFELRLANIEKLLKAS